MAATRLIALHVNKGRSSASTLKDRLDYSQNHDKTDDGRLISAYQCDPETAWQEFDLSLKEYARLVGREGQTVSLLNMTQIKNIVFKNILRQRDE